jgi:hypothetical protein
VSIAAWQGGALLHRFVPIRFLKTIRNPIEVVRAWYCFRCFASAGLEEFRCDLNSDGFVFDSQMICIGFHFLGISCPTHCQPVAAPTEFGKSLQDGMGMFKNSLQTRLSRYGWPRTPLFGGS